MHFNETMEIIDRLVLLTYHQSKVVDHGIRVCYDPGDGSPYIRLKITLTDDQHRRKGCNVYDVGIPLASIIQTIMPDLGTIYVDVHCLQTSETQEPGYSDIERGTK